MWAALRMVVAIAIAAAYSFCSIGAGGFGHGWTSATSTSLPGCVFLAFAVNNGLLRFPSRASALVQLSLTGGSTVALYLGTQLEGSQYF
jgi:hypothetical protein